MRNTVTFVTPRMAPAAGKRVVAITQIAMFDAINSIERRYQPDLSQLLAAATASKEAAAAAAARIALAGLLPQVGGQVKVTMAVISWRSGTEFYRVLPRVSRSATRSSATMATAARSSAIRRLIRRPIRSCFRHGSCHRQP
jgi:hypothetical protein